MGKIPGRCHAAVNSPFKNAEGREGAWILVPFEPVTVPAFLNPRPKT